jgi:hypothetical protein
MDCKISSKVLARLARTELTDDLGMTMEVDFGNDFWNALFYGTLKTFVERVDNTGFCQTSYGEENNIKCYGQRHYPRDASEAARMLADCGFIEPAISIIEFNLRNIPEGQYYIPHVYRRDGSIQANTIQIDTPAHVANALVRCVELTGPTDRLRQLFLKMDEIMEGTWSHHFHPDLNVLDAGNYNEQGFGGGSEPICDLFTNCSMARAMTSMAKMAVEFAMPQKSELYRNHFECLSKGIETTLYDSSKGTYCLKYDLDTGKKDNSLNWMSIYCQRWYEGKPSAWDRSLEILKDTTSLNWDDMRVITGLSDNYEVLGKVYAQLLAYLGQTGRMTLLNEHMVFAEKTVRRPSNVFPERWYYRQPEPLGEYHQWFFSNFEGIWQAYRDNPNGDYTIDSGNCEQSAVFLCHQVEDILGIRLNNDTLQIWPKLPFEFPNITVKAVPVKKVGDRIKHAGYELTRQENQVRCRITADDISPIQLTLAVPAQARQISVNVNGKVRNDFTVRKENDVQWVSIILESKDSTSDVILTGDNFQTKAKHQ